MQTIWNTQQEVDKLDKLNQGIKQLLEINNPTCVPKETLLLLVEVSQQYMLLRDKSMLKVVR